MQHPVSSIRGVLAGFAGLLLLMGGLAVDSGLQIRNVSARSAALRKESRYRDSLLDQLRTDAHRSSTLIRDYLVEDDDIAAAAERAELLQLRARVEQDLRDYERGAPENEKKAVRDLHRRADSYWASLAPALDWDLAAKRERRETFLRNTVIPNRDGLVQFARQVTAIDDRLLDRAEEQIQLVQAAFQHRVTAISTLALIMGAMLAVVVVFHTRHLGAEAEERYKETLAAREDLRRLSDRLVSVQEEERRSLSRELHDELGQVMSAILMEIGKLDSAVPGSGIHRDSLASVRRLAEENVAKVRDMALLLRPAMLDELGLIPALRWQAREVARRTGLRVKVIANEQNDDLADANRTCVFRVVQEALNNCAKHSGASEVRVIVQRDSDGLSISVQDDGVGFDPAHNKGLGLLGMMERVSGLGGQFHIESKPGNGTILSTWFRLENDPCKVVEEHVA